MANGCHSIPHFHRNQSASHPKVGARVRCLLSNMGKSSYEWLPLCPPSRFTSRVPGNLAESSALSPALHPVQTVEHGKINITF